MYMRGICIKIVACNKKKWKKESNDLKIEIARLEMIHKEKQEQNIKYRLDQVIAQLKLLESRQSEQQILFAKQKNCFSLQINQAGVLLIY